MHFAFRISHFYETFTLQGKQGRGTNSHSSSAQQEVDWSITLLKKETILSIYNLEKSMQTAQSVTVRWRCECKKSWWSSFKVSKKLLRKHSGFSFLAGALSTQLINQQILANRFSSTFIDTFWLPNSRTHQYLAVNVLSLYYFLFDSWKRS